MKAYKIFEVKNDLPKFMFFGLNGSKFVPMDEWLIAKNKKVRDGSGKWYISRFHVYENIDKIDKFINTLKNKDTRCVVEVVASNMIPKSKNSKAHLTDKIFLSKEAWDKRIPVLDFKKGKL